VLRLLLEAGSVMVAECLCIGQRKSKPLGLRIGRGTREIQPAPVHTKERKEDEMGLSESQEARTEKMMAVVFDTVVNEQLSPRVETQWDYDIYCALLYGSTKFGQSLVTDVPSLRKAWGKGSKKKATNLCEVCTYPMISMWFRRLVVENMKVSEKDKRKGIRTTISSILDAFLTKSDEKVRDFLNLDIQYNHDMDRYESKQVEMPLVTYTTLLVSKLNGALGLRDLVDWENQAFPIEDPEDIGYYHDWREIAHIALLIRAGSVSLFKAFWNFRTK
jgi:hypothetical protein